MSMVKNHDLTIRVTKEERERIRNMAMAKGFPTVSAFIRDFALKNSITMEQRILEMHQAIVGARSEIDAAINALGSNYSPDSVFYSMKEQYLPKTQTYKPNPIYKPDPLIQAGLQPDYSEVHYS